MRWTRRQALQTVLAAGGGIVLPHGLVWPQEQPTALVRAPKHALVIGNSKYRHAPLKNPANDARAMADVLKAVGFDIFLGLEWSQTEMDNAIRQFADGLGKRNAIGLFYFAGHGAQLAWRNYAIPVDANIETIDELRLRCIDINTVIEGMRRAGNPMNLVILDACRDNPTGTRVRPNEQGLSQIDAPSRSLLAYATAPGHTAIDGEGEHGLYTEHLLKEIQVPESRIEDVFKRVRLAVRRRSNGLQIPWESTSLEEDFYFRPPKSLVKLSEAQAVKQFEQELAIWEKIRVATDPAPLEDYLGRFPSGHFSEPARLRLEQVLARQGEKKIQIVSSPENPYSKGTVVADTNRKVGDSYSYRVTDLYTGIETARVTDTITRVTDTEVVYDSGLITDLLGNILRYRDGLRSTGGQVWGVEYEVGKRWTSRSRITTVKGEVLQGESQVRVVAREKISVPAGTFDAFVVEANGWVTGGTNSTQTRRKRWIAPDRVRAEIVTEAFRQRAGRVVLAEREELVSYRQS